MNRDYERLEDARRQVTIVAFEQARKEAYLNGVKNGRVDATTEAEREADVVKEQAQSLIDQLIEIEYTAERAVAVVEAVVKLRDDGYDGAFMGESVEPLFQAVRKYELACLAMATKKRTKAKEVAVPDGWEYDHHPDYVHMEIGQTMYNMGKYSGHVSHFRGGELVREFDVKPADTINMLMEVQAKHEIYETEQKTALLCEWSRSRKDDIVYMSREGHACNLNLRNGDVTYSIAGEIEWQFALVVQDHEVMVDEVLAKIAAYVPSVASKKEEEAWLMEYHTDIIHIRRRNEAYHLKIHNGDVTHFIDAKVVRRFSTPMADQDTMIATLIKQGNEYGHAAVFTPVPIRSLAYRPLSEKHEDVADGDYRGWKLRKFPTNVSMVRDDMGYHVGTKTGSVDYSVNGRHIRTFNIPVRSLYDMLDEILVAHGDFSSEKQHKAPQPWGVECNGSYIDIFRGHELHRLERTTGAVKYLVKHHLEREFNVDLTDEDDMVEAVIQEADAYAHTLIGPAL